MTQFLDICWLVIELAFLCILFVLVSAITAAIVVGPPVMAGRWLFRYARR